MYSLSNPQEFRINFRIKLKELVKNEKISTNVEIACYNYAIQQANQRKIIKKWENKLFSQIYIDHLRTIYYNLQNPEILKKIQEEELSPQTFVFMTHQEMNTELWKNLIENKIRKDKNKFNNNIQASTNLFKCKKCGERNCSYYELQTRSSDESTTIFVSCLSCGANFKIC
jgi:DNA-directed RNA polymerase subunit M/transcription elongation factor TFIIS